MVQVEGGEQEDSGGIPDNKWGGCQVQVVKNCVTGYHGNEEVAPTSTFKFIF